MWWLCDPVVRAGHSRCTVHGIALTRQLSQNGMQFLMGKRVGVATMKSSNEHCVVALCRDDVSNPWTVQYCTSVVEINVFDASVSLEMRPGGVAEVPELRGSGPIVRAISYHSTLE